MRRLEARLGVRLLHRTTRGVLPTEAGARLLERLGPALGAADAAMDAVNGFRDRPAGTLRLNVPVSAARLARLVPAPLGLRRCHRGIVSGREPGAGRPAGPTGDNAMRASVVRRYWALRTWRRAPEGVDRPGLPGAERELGP